MLSGNDYNEVAAVVLGGVMRHEELLKLPVTAKTAEMKDR